jgi:hypothetical protein
MKERRIPAVGGKYKGFCAKCNKEFAECNLGRK